ncbi:hypothetical protein [Devosia sp.]|nr:hypothetical protein [Devosia sp.]
MGATADASDHSRFGTFIGLNAVMALAYGIACGASQFFNML